VEPPPLLEPPLLLELLPLPELPPLLEPLLLELPLPELLLELLPEPLVPVPDTATLRAAAPPPAVTFNVAVLAPVEVGSNTTLRLHALPAATLAPQPLLNKNWPAPEPLRAMPVIGSANSPVFDKVTALAALMVPLVWLPKVSVVGASA
jgi:hypothetical protein